MVITEGCDECQPHQIKILCKVENWLNPQPHLNILFNKRGEGVRDQKKTDVFQALEQREDPLQHRDVVCVDWTGFDGVFHTLQCNKDTDEF